MIKDVLKFVLLVALIVIPIRTFIAQPFVVNGASMNPTFAHGDYLIVDQLSYRFNEPQRGEVVVFQYPNDPSQFFIKRIIGLPGETIELEDKTITIINDNWPQGFELDEPYLDSEDSSSVEYRQSRVSLSDQEYYVLGDNRSHSSDSRSWGPLSSDKVIGRPLVRLFPITIPPPLFPGSFNNQYRFY